MLNCLQCIVFRCTFASRNETTGFFERYNYFAGRFKRLQVCKGT